MARTATTKATKKPTNLTLDQQLVADAKELGVSLSQAAEAGLRAAVAEAKGAAWKRDNAEAIAYSNEWVKKHGLPLAKHRLF